MNRRFTSAGLLVSTLALSMAGFVSAVHAQPLGRVLFATGDVSIVSRDGATRPARRGERIGPGDRIVTGEGALGQLRMSDGALIGVRARSNLTFPGSTAGGDGAARVLSVEGGSIRLLNLVGETASTGKPYVLKTPHGDIRLSDSDAQAAVGTGGSEARTVVKLDRGTGTAAARDGTPLALNAGEAVSVSPARVDRVALQTGRAALLSTRGRPVATDSLSRRSAQATPPEAGGGLQPGGLSPGAFSAELPSVRLGQRRYAGLGLQPELAKNIPDAPRAEDSFRGPYVQTPIRGDVRLSDSDAQAVVVTGGSDAGIEVELARSTETPAASDGAPKAGGALQRGELPPARLGQGRYKGLKLQPGLARISPAAPRARDRIIGTPTAPGLSNPGIGSVTQAALAGRLPGLGVPNSIADQIGRDPNLGNDLVEVLGAASFNQRPTISSGSVLRGGRTPITPSRTPGLTQTATGPATPALVNTGGTRALGPISSSAGTTRIDIAGDRLGAGRLGVNGRIVNTNPRLLRSR